MSKWNGQAHPWRSTCLSQARSQLCFLWSSSPCRSNIRSYLACTQKWTKSPDVGFVPRHVLYSPASMSTSAKVTGNTEPMQACSPISALSSPACAAKALKACRRIAAKRTAFESAGVDFLILKSKLHSVPGHLDSAADGLHSGTRRNRDTHGRWAGAVTATAGSHELGTGWFRPGYPPPAGCVHTVAAGVADCRCGQCTWAGGTHVQSVQLQRLLAAYSSVLQYHQAKLPLIE